MTLKPGHGDILHVRMKCNSVGDTLTNVSPLRSGGLATTVAIIDIVHIEPRILQQGDKVRHNFTRSKFTVIAAKGGYAFVEDDDGNVFTYDINNLTVESV